MSILGKHILVTKKKINLQGIKSVYGIWSANTKHIYNAALAQ